VNELAPTWPFGRRLAQSDVMMTMDLERRVALTELMATPDPPELKRGHRQRFEGRPDRYEMVPMLAMLFAQTRLIEFQERAGYRT
jgi:hypothetical protein